MGGIEEKLPDGEIEWVYIGTTYEVMKSLVVIRA